MNFADYKSKVTVPGRPVMPRLPTKPTQADYRSHGDAMAVYELDLIKFKNAVKARRDDQHELDEKLKEDMLQEAGLGSHPNKYSIWEFACEYTCDDPSMEPTLEFLEKMASLINPT